MDKNEIRVISFLFLNSYLNDFIEEFVKIKMCEIYYSNLNFSQIKTTF